MIGVTCSTIANGRKARSTHGDSANRLAITMPLTTDSASAPAVIFTVNHQAGASDSKCCASVAATRLGAGRM